MSSLDWIFTALLLGSMLIGAWRGLVFEVLSLCGWLVSFFAAQWFAPEMGALLPMAEFDPTLRYAAGFAVVFVLAMFLCGFVTWLAKRLIESIGLRPADRAMGALFGVLRGIVLLLVLSVLAGLTQIHEAPWWGESWVARLVDELLVGIAPGLPQEFGRYLPS